MDNCPQSTSGMGQHGTFTLVRINNSIRIINNTRFRYNTMVGHHRQTLRILETDNKYYGGDQYFFICDNNGLIIPFRAFHRLTFFLSQTFEFLEGIRKKKSQDEREQRMRAEEDAFKRMEKQFHQRKQIRQQKLAKEIQIREHERKSRIQEEAEVGNQANETNGADTSQEQAQNVEQNREVADVDNPVELAAPVSRRARRASVLPRRRISMRVNIPRTRSGHKRI
ncbi:unnamed protein product [Orchesella dallaii]|uniref:Uncharacterized protein n=1 Tax=Orchesella dallaii TaxID=48710 RepID=A0ABP1RRP2_9HEXA